MATSYRLLSETRESPAATTHASHSRGRARRSFGILLAHTCRRRHRLLPAGQGVLLPRLRQLHPRPGHALRQSSASASGSAPSAAPTRTTTHHRRHPSPSRQPPSSPGRRQYRPRRGRCCSCRRPVGPSRTSCSSPYVHRRGHRRSITNQSGESLMLFGGILGFARLILHFWHLVVRQIFLICNFI